MVGVCTSWPIRKRSHRKLTWCTSARTTGVKPASRGASDFGSTTAAGVRGVAAHVTRATY